MPGRGPTHQSQRRWMPARCQCMRRRLKLKGECRLAYGTDYNVRYRASQMPSGRLSADMSRVPHTFATYEGQGTCLIFENQKEGGSGSQANGKKNADQYQQDSTFPRLTGYWSAAHVCPTPGGAVRLVCPFPGGSVLTRRDTSHASAVLPNK